MKWSANRAWVVLGLSLALGACQSPPPEPPPPAPPLDPVAQTVEQLEASLQAGHLGEADTRLERLRSDVAGDSRIQRFRRQLAEAYLAQGRRALQQGDMDVATVALSRARTLMQAPALTTGLDGALEHARRAQQAQQAADQARHDAEAAAAEAAEQVQSDPEP